MSINIQETNEQLKDKDPIDIIRWALSLNKKAILTTNFGPHEAAIIHMTHQVDPQIPVVWMDSGYNTPDTYKFAHKLITDLKLNMKIYSPQWSKGYRDVVMGGTPQITDTNHELFTEQVKLEPFKRAMNELKPEVWLTAIRKDQTAFRGNLNILTSDDGKLFKVAPVFYWTEKDLEKYIADNNLPMEKNYFDPTKALEHRECGLHLGGRKRESGE